MSYSYDGRGNRLTGSGPAVAYTVNENNQLTSRTVGASGRGYGVSGKVAPGAQVKVFHPGAPLGEVITAHPTTGVYEQWWSDPGAGVTRVELLVRGTKTGAGESGRDAVADQKVWVTLPLSSESYTYDGAGRLSEDGTWVYDWNALGQLTSLTRKANTAADPNVATEVIAYGYDSDGRRTSRTRTVTYQDSTPTLTETSKVLWEKWHPVMEERTLNGSSLPRRWFVWGRDVSGSIGGAGGIGGLVSITEEGGRTLLPMDDGLGNIIAVVDASSRTVIARYDYGPFGEIVSETGEVGACPFRFQSKWWDAAAGLNYFGYRHYNPKMGRWLSRDPLGEAGGFNLYAYCGNDPVNKWDYLGMEPQENKPFMYNIIGKFFEALAPSTMGTLARDSAHSDILMVRAGVRQHTTIPLAVPVYRAGVAIRDFPSKTLHEMANASEDAAVYVIETSSDPEDAMVLPTMGAAISSSFNMASGILDFKGQTDALGQWVEDGYPIYEPTIGNIRQGYEQGDWSRVFRGVGNTTGTATVIVAPIKSLRGIEINPARWNYRKMNPLNYDWRATIGMDAIMEGRLGSGWVPAPPKYLGQPLKTGDIVNYRPTNPGFENHHGVLDVWATHNIRGYVSRSANSPSMVMTEAQHNATRSVYRQWLKEKTGREVGGRVDWTKVSAREAQTLSERMFDAAGISQAARQSYYRAFYQYIY